VSIETVGTALTVGWGVAGRGLADGDALAVAVAVGDAVGVGVVGAPVTVTEPFMVAGCAVQRNV
jgi:hypothetical protein